ncbi:MAG: ATP-binding protein, partial [Actinomycetota bacterium]|nr:ATP-binding protein [Actinomycetota bacterium]
GVPSEFQPQLFQRFLTAPRNPSGTPSIGLGLSIARDLARVQGGDTWYQPNTPSGACFVVRLPAHPGPDEDPPHSEAPEPQSVP